VCRERLDFFVGSLEDEGLLKRLPEVDGNEDLLYVVKVSRTFKVLQTSVLRSYVSSFDRLFVLQMLAVCGQEKLARAETALTQTLLSII
jgi:hypothetical protein